MRIKYVILYSFLPVLFLGIFYNSLNDNNKANLYKELPVEYVDATYAFDTSSVERAIGISDYVFVAKINKIIRT